MMRRWILFLAVFILCGDVSAPAGDIFDPDVVATVFIDGIDSDGPDREGVVGLDRPEELLDEITALMSLASGVTSPTASNQITVADYYGNQYPDYYTEEDAAEVDAITDEYGGIPRYAMIMAKFCRHVMERSGARQVNLIGASMGAYVARWMIENDYEQLASSGKIARFISIEGVIGGNWIATQGGSLLEQFADEYDYNAIDLIQMQYDWLEDNLHDPRTEMDNALYRNIQVMHWASTDDDKNQRILTVVSGEANDGVQLYEDTYFHTSTAQSRFFDQPPTLSHAFASHDTIKAHLGIRAGLVAALTSTRRVRITLKDATLQNIPEDLEIGELDDHEIAFGCRVISPLAQTRYSITTPINRIGAESHTVELFEADEGETISVDQILFDDFVLPDETELRLAFDVLEIDKDELVYQVIEFSDDDELKSNPLVVSTGASESYSHDSVDWNGTIEVEVIDYPDFLPPDSILPADIREHLLDQNTLDEERLPDADVNGDGVVDIADLIGMLR